VPPASCVGMKNSEGVFPSLPARNERGESRREGKLTKNCLLSPALSSFFEEEREKGCAAALQANYAFYRCSAAICHRSQKPIWRPTLGSTPVCGSFPRDYRQNNAHFLERLLAQEPFCVHDWWLSHG